MKSSMIWIILICIVVAISIIILFSKNETSSSKDILGDNEINDYIIDLWINYDSNNTYTKEQLVVISLTAYDSEINNGGLCQFFSNSSKEFAPNISNSLEEINAIKHKDLFDKFIKDNKINLKELDSYESDNVEDFIDKYDDIPFEDFDRKYYELEKEESITNLLIEYTKSNYNEIIKEEK